MSNPTANVLYQTHESRLDTVGSFTKNQIQIWQMIRSAYKHYELTVDENIPRNEFISNFIVWLSSEWGILLSQDGPVFNKDFKIINEEKYLLFTLKWS
jgi:hypothetical protein